MVEKKEYLVDSWTTGKKKFLDSSTTISERDYAICNVLLSAIYELVNCRKGERQRQRVGPEIKRQNIGWVPSVDLLNYEPFVGNRALCGRCFLATC